MNTSPEKNTITVRTRGDTERTILFSPSRFFMLNEEHMQEEGISLTELAIEDPTEAYRFIRGAIGFIAANNTAEVIEDKTLLADKRLDGEVSVAEVAESAIMKYLPAPYEGAELDVTVQLLATEADIAMGWDQPTTVMELHVEPPDLA